MPLQTGSSGFDPAFIHFQEKPALVLSSAAPGHRDGGDVRSKGVWPWQCTDEVQVNGAEGPHCSVCAAAEDHLFRQRQGLGHTRLQDGGTTGTSVHFT